MPVINYDFKKLIVNPPVTGPISEPSVSYERNPIKINYLEREQHNSKIGKLGEKLVLEY